MITQSAGFRHQPVNRAGKDTCQVERVLAEIGKKSGVFTTVNSQNAIESITRENLKQFDGMFFTTTGMLLAGDPRDALMEFINQARALWVRIVQPIPLRNTITTLR